MSTPYQFTPRIPAPPHPTPTSVSAYILPNLKPGKAPIRNPYDKFTQPEFDAWIGGITGALRRALGHAEEETESRQQCETAQIKNAYRIPQYAPGYLEESEDEAVNDSFAEIKARRTVGKGKARDPREGPGLGNGDITKPIEIASSDEEQEEEEEVELSIAHVNGLEGEDEKEEGEEEDEEYSDEEYSWQRGQSSSQLFSSPQRSRKRILIPIDEALEGEEDEGKEEDQEEGAPTEYEENEDEYEEVESPYYRQSSPQDEIIEIISDDDEPQSTQKRQTKEASYDEEDTEENIQQDEEYENSREYAKPNDTSQQNPSDLQILIRRPRNDPAYIVDDEQEGVEGDYDDEIEVVQPLDSDTSFPPRFSVPAEAKGAIEIPDPWSGPRIFAQDYYSGGDLRVQPGAHIDAHHLGPEDEDPVQELAARKEQDELEDSEIQPLNDDTSFPPDEAQEGPVNIPDAWEGPETYAQDYYSSGDVRTLPGQRVDPAFLMGTGDTDSGIDSFLTPDVLSPNNSESFFDENDEEFILPPSSQHYVAPPLAHDRPIPAGAQIINVDDSDEETDFQQSESAEVLGYSQDANLTYGGSRELQYDPNSVEDLIYGTMDFVASETPMTLEEASEGVHGDFSFQHDQELQNIDNTPGAQDEVISTLVNWNNPPAFPSGLLASAPGHLVTPSPKGDNEPPFVTSAPESEGLDQQNTAAVVDTESSSAVEAPSTSEDDVCIVPLPQTYSAVPMVNDDEVEFIPTEKGVEAMVVDDTPLSTDSVIEQEIIPFGERNVTLEAVNSETLAQILPILTEQTNAQVETTVFSTAISDVHDIPSAPSGITNIVEEFAPAEVGHAEVGHAEVGPAETGRGVDSVQKVDSSDSQKPVDSVIIDDLEMDEAPKAESTITVVDVSAQADTAVADTGFGQGSAVDDVDICSDHSPQEEDGVQPADSSSSTAYSHFQQSQDIQSQLLTPPSEKVHSLPRMEDEDQISVVQPSVQDHHVKVEGVPDDNANNADSIQPYNAVHFEVDKLGDEETAREYTVVEVVTDEDGDGYTDEDADGEVDQESIEVISVTSSSDRWEKDKQPEDGAYTVDEPVTEGRLTEEPPDDDTNTRMNFEPEATSDSVEFHEQGSDLLKHIVSREPSPEDLVSINAYSTKQDASNKDPGLVDSDQIEQVFKGEDNRFNDETSTHPTTVIGQIEVLAPFKSNSEVLLQVPALPLTSGSALDLPVTHNPVIEPATISSHSVELQLTPMQQQTVNSTTPVGSPDPERPNLWASVAQNLFGLSADDAELEALSSFYSLPAGSPSGFSTPLPETGHSGGEGQVTEEASAPHVMADVFGDIKSTTVQPSSINIGATNTSTPSSSVTMTARKPSIPILMADPYPYSLSTPGSSSVFPIADEASEEDTGLDNSMSSNSTLEKEPELGEKHVADILDDVEDLELQYPSEIEAEENHPREEKEKTTAFELPISKQHEFLVEPYFFSNVLDNKHSTTMPTGRIEAQNPSASFQRDVIAASATQSEYVRTIVVDASLNSGLTPQSTPESLFPVTSVKASESTKRTIKRKRDTPPSANQTSSAAVVEKLYKGKGKRTSTFERKGKIEELQASIPESTSEEIIYVRPRATTAARDTLPRTASDTFVGTQSSSTVSNHKPLQSPSRSTSTVSSAPSDKTLPQALPTINKPNFPHVQSQPPVSLFHAHGQKRKQNFVPFPSKPKKHNPPQKPFISRTSSASQVIEQPVISTPAVAPVAPLGDVIPMPATLVSSTVDTGAPPALAVDSQVQTASPVMSPIPVTPSSTSPAPAPVTPSVTATPLTTEPYPVTEPPIIAGSSIAPSPQPISSYISAPAASSQTSTVSTVRRKHSTPTTSSPVTRSHCRYHRISLPKEEGGPRVCFLVPGCSLNDKELMEEEEIEDHGDATQEDSYRMIRDIESLQFDADLIGILRQLVGLDILREQEVFYLPQPGEEVTRKSTSVRKPSIPERTTMVRVPGESSSYAGSPTYSGYAGSPNSHRAPSVADSTSTSLSALRKNLGSSEKGSSFAPSDTEGDISDYDERHPKRVRPSPPEESKAMGPPGSSKSRSKSKAKPRRSKKDLKPEEGGQGSELAEGVTRKPRKSTKRGVKRSRTSDTVGEEVDDDRSNKRLKTHPTAPPSLLSSPGKVSSPEKILSPVLSTETMLPSEKAEPSS